MPKTEIKYAERFHMKADKAFLDALDKICKREVPEMSKSDMVRKLVLEAAARKTK